MGNIGAVVDSAGELLHYVLFDFDGSGKFGMSIASVFCSTLLVTSSSAGTKGRLRPYYSLLPETPDYPDSTVSCDQTVPRSLCWGFDCSGPPVG